MLKHNTVPKWGTVIHNIGKTGIGTLHAFYFVDRAMAIMKARLKGAQKGHSLLKKKADALTMRFRAILKKIIEVRLLYRCNA